MWSARPASILIGERSVRRNRTVENDGKMRETDVASAQTSLPKEYDKNC